MTSSHENGTWECLVLSGHWEVSHHAPPVHVLQVTVVVLAVQVETGWRVVIEEEFPLELRVDLYRSTYERVLGRKSSTDILQSRHFQGWPNEMC